MLTWSMSEYIKFWSMIPLWIQILVLVFVIWFTFFKYKAPQRILVMWVASWYSMLVKSSTQFSTEEKERGIAFANTKIQQALDNKLEDIPSPSIREEEGK